jgi:prepilin signal peptidase PulO-like enzyme (type II secretory pathway)
LVDATTSSLAALRSFSDGDKKRALGADLESIPFYQRAVDLDPQFALAFARLGTVYSNIGEQEQAKRFYAKAIGGAALGAGGLFLLAFLWERLRGVEAMGMGDVKMLGMVGALLGAPGVVVTVLLASVTGSLVGLALILVRRGSLQTALPFGVFLALGAIAAFFWAPALVDLYRGALR